MPSRTNEDLLVALLLGESANQGPEGLAMVADTLFNRAQAQHQTLEQVAFAPHQFAAAQRPDLAAFAAKQPVRLQHLARQLVQERRVPTFHPTYQTQHYVTQALWNRRNTLPKSHWLHRMTPVGTVGDHVLLQETPLQ